MQLHERIDVSQLHHAYIIENSQVSEESIRSLLSSLSEVELHIRHFDTFGIDESRELIALAHMKSHGSQVFAYLTRSCTREAQNALLKLFEEPPQHTHFFLSVDTVQGILPTLRSRSFLIAHENAENKNKDIENFMKASLKERLAYIEPIVKEKNVTLADALLCDIEEYVHASGDVSAYAQVLTHIVHVRQVLYDKGASLKILLESVALTTPRFS